MMGKLKPFIIGIAAGCMSWAVCPLVSDRIEPFDTDIGFIIGQTILSIFAIYLGADAKARTLLIGVFGMYAGQNLYASVVGDSGWFLVGLITTSFLCIIPLFIGFLTMGAIVLFRRIKPEGA